MKLAWETLAAAVLVAACMLFVGRYQIATIGSGMNNGNSNVAYRLDRWTGKIDTCQENSRYEPSAKETLTWVECRTVDPDDQGKK